MTRFSWLLRAFALALFALPIACGSPNPTPVPTPPTVLAISTDISNPSNSDEGNDSVFATSTPTAVPTKTPSASPTPMDPLSIASARARTYPGSQFKIEQTLEPGSNYDRYIASYMSDGLKINGLLTVPRGKKPATGFPVIIFNHGYIPPKTYRTTERYVAYVDRIAQSGYIVFKSDYRGHGSSEGDARGGYGYPDYTTDVLNAVGSMRQYADADPNRIGMWGHSMGGYITLRALTIDPTIKAASIWSGVVASYPDMLSLWHHPVSGAPRPTPADVPDHGRPWRNDLIDKYGTPEQNPTFWNSISANSFLADVSAPIQLHATNTDQEVPFVFSELLDQQILAVDGTVEFYKYTGDNHNLSASFDTAMTRTIAFFDKYVK